MRYDISAPRCTRDAHTRGKGELTPILRVCMLATRNSFAYYATFPRLPSPSPGGGRRENATIKRSHDDTTAVSSSSGTSSSPRDYAALISYPMCYPSTNQDAVANSYPPSTKASRYPISNEIRALRLTLRPPYYRKPPLYYRNHHQ